LTAARRTIVLGPIDGVAADVDEVAIGAGGAQTGHKKNKDVVAARGRQESAKWRRTSKIKNIVAMSIPSRGG